MRLNFIKKRAIEQFGCQQKPIVSWLSDELKPVFTTSINEEAQRKILEKFTGQVHLLSDQDKLEVSNQIYHIVMDLCTEGTCSQAKSNTKAGIDLIGKFILILKSLVNDDCTLKKLDDRFLDTKGRVLLINIESAIKSLAAGKNSQTLSTQQYPPFAPEILSSSTVTSNSDTTLLLAVSNTTTEFPILAVSQGAWSHNRTNTTSEIFSLPKATEIPFLRSCLAAGMHGAFMGGAEYFILDCGNKYLKKQYPTQPNLVWALRIPYSISMASFPLLYKSLESSFFAPEALQIKEGLYNSLFTLSFNLLLQWMFEQTQQHGLNQSKLAQFFWRFIPLLACISVVFSAEKPIEATIAWGLNFMMHILIYYALMQCAPMNFLESSNSSQESEVPEQAPPMPISRLNRIGTFHERSLQNQERMTQPVLAIQLAEPSPQETIYSEINELSLKIPQEKSINPQEALAKSAVLQSDYIDMNATKAKRSSMFALYAEPKKPKPVQKAPACSVLQDINSTEASVCRMNLR